MGETRNAYRLFVWKPEEISIWKIEGRIILR
jgi:hypothetical protein